MTDSPKATYRIRNWKEYDAGLKQRSSITFWVSDDVIKQSIIVHSEIERSSR